MFLFAQANNWSFSASFHRLHMSSLSRLAIFPQRRVRVLLDEVALSAMIVIIVKSMRLRNELTDTSGCAKCDAVKSAILTNIMLVAMPLYHL